MGRRMTTSHGLVTILLLSLASGCAASARSAAAPVSAPANEAECMALAELAYAEAAGHPMSSLGDAPVPDAAYEDTYAACVGGLPACPTEDSCGCYWDASRAGNGRGRSFVAPACTEGQ